MFRKTARCGSSALLIALVLTMCTPAFAQQAWARSRGEVAER